MGEGAMRHGTDMQMESNYVDSDGQSFIGCGVTRLLGFDLLPRIKQINRRKLYLPGPGDLELYPRLRPALTNPITLGPDREQLRPDDEVRHRHPAWHRLHRGDPAAVPLPGHPPPPPRGGRGWAGPEDNAPRACHS